MKLFVAIISFLLCFSLIMAQDCAFGCLDVYSPTCGEAQIGGRTVRCQFSNSCQLERSSCSTKISKYLVGHGLYLTPYPSEISILTYRYSYSQQIGEKLVVLISLLIADSTNNSSKHDYYPTRWEQVFSN